ncbi:hypothetical protein DEO72_LG3g1272 [Vigna unguiculata]|uniref:Uncharacterized protein n=1 Tax=Vigna unguiculata TaxID=3917 RepID=A0A4D6LEA5_VIGUN|nr:hypothetical protein DEO72_LG3g1272 [Vigna unguiculata]
MEHNDCKNARVRRKLVLQQRFNARSHQHSYDKEENVRKKTKFANHSSQNKPTVSQRSFQKNIDRNPLQQLDINVDNNNNLHNMNSIFHRQIVTVNKFSSFSSTLVEQQITSQSATSTLTYHSPFAFNNNSQRNYGQNNYNSSAGGRSEVVNESHSVSKNKVVKYPFQVI